MIDYITKDSGARETFETGARRDVRRGKGRYDLLPWWVIKRWALLMERGAEKYGDNNWKKGMPLPRYFDSAIRHLTAWYAGETDEDHLAACLFNVAAIMWTEGEINAGRLPESLRGGIDEGGETGATSEP